MRVEIFSANNSTSMSKRKIEQVSSVESSDAKRLQAQLDDILVDLDATHQRKILASLDPEEIVTLCNESERWRDACQSFPSAFWSKKMREIFGPDWKQQVTKWYENARPIGYETLGGWGGAQFRFATPPDLDTLTFDTFAELVQQWNYDNAFVFVKNRPMQGMQRGWGWGQHGPGGPPIPVPQD